MTLAIERPTAPLVPLDSSSVHEAIQDHLSRIDLETEERLGIVHTRLMEVEVPGPHRLLVLDESKQPTGAFKYNGMAYAVDTMLSQDPGIETFYTWSAGNAAAAVARAAANYGRKAVVLTPRSIPAPKRRNIEQSGGKVVAEHDNPQDGLAKAEALADADETRAFLHPYNNLFAIAGQGQVGRRLVEGLLEHSIQGPVDVLVQRGGGSLLASIASVLKGANIADLRTLEVRPERTAADTLDKRYDGLAVEEPGSYAAAILRNSQFVQGGVVISERHTGLAGLLIASSRPFLGRRYEPSGLAGVAAFERLSAENQVPTTYVTVLSGKNVTAEIYADFADAPRRAQRATLDAIARASLAARGLAHTQARRRRNGTKILSGAMVGYRQG